MIQEILNMLSDSEFDVFNIRRHVVFMKIKTVLKHGIEHG